ncbi:hypothetical protein ACIGO9_29905 [Nocardia asteroides]|uniref:hypothetical protein n=1 Tax=Nocardia asteroides TaxID=1824 RepID=UPI0037C644A1
MEVTHRRLPADVALPPLPTRRDGRVDRYQQVVLDIRTGELQFYCADWRVRLGPRSHHNAAEWKAWFPGAIPPTSSLHTAGPVPDRLTFVIDTWTPVEEPRETEFPTPAWTYMAREQGEAFVASLVALAQQLVDGLFLVADTDDLEWSAESVAVAAAIGTACSRYHQGPHGVEVSRAGMVDAEELLAEFPGLIDEQWAEMDNETLDIHAKFLTTQAQFSCPEAVERFGRPRGGQKVLEVFGARSWLYRYRAHHAGPRPVRSAEQWFASRPARPLAGQISADFNDDDLAALAGRERESAARDGVTLVGVETFLRAWRDELRTRIVDIDLPRAAEAVQRLERAKAARAGLLGQIVGWADPRYNNDAELGRRAGMTRQAVNKLRQTLIDTD